MHAGRWRGEAAGLVRIWEEVARRVALGCTTMGFGEMRDCMNERHGGDGKMRKAVDMSK